MKDASQAADLQRVFLQFVIAVTDRVGILDGNRYGSVELLAETPASCAAAVIQKPLIQQLMPLAFFNEAYADCSYLNEPRAWMYVCAASWLSPSPCSLDKTDSFMLSRSGSFRNGASAAASRNHQ